MLPLNRKLIHTGIILLAGLFCSTISLGQDDPVEQAPVPAQTQLQTQVAAPASDASSDAPRASSLESTEASSESSTEASSEPVPWSKKVDGWFAKYLVTPLVYVLWFSVYKDVPFIVVWLLGGGIYLTLRMGFINLRGFWHAIQLTRGVYDDPEDVGEVSHFQALSAALSATVGLGNIGGVAVAIGLGGPGAAFWIFLVGFVGMSTKFAECTLGQMYRTADSTGHALGGPMRYLRLGLKEIGLRRLGVVLSTLFAILCIGASFGGGNAYQVSQSLSAIKTDFPVLQSHPWIYGLAMAVAVGAVIIGGIQSIGRVASRIVPLMCFAYVSASLWILFQNVHLLGDAMQLIWDSAFEPYAPLAGGTTAVIVMGIKRAVFSNEAGVGSAAIAHSAAKTNEPVSEGIVALLEPFIDTMVVCSITALVIIVSGTYNAGNIKPADAKDVVASELRTAQSDSAGDTKLADEADVIESKADHESFAFTTLHSPETVVSAVSGASDGQTPLDEQAEAARIRLAELIKNEEGAAITLVAFRSSGYHWFGYVLYVAVVLFAFSTCISWSYYGERCCVSLLGAAWSVPYKLLYITFTFLGSVVTAKNILEFSDLMILSMALPNLLGVFLLSGVVSRALKEYWGKYKSDSLR